MAVSLNAANPPAAHAPPADAKPAITVTAILLTYKTFRVNAFDQIEPHADH